MISYSAPLAVAEYGVGVDVTGARRRAIGSGPSSGSRPSAKHVATEALEGRRIVTELEAGERREVEVAVVVVLPYQASVRSRSPP